MNSCDLMVCRYPLFVLALPSVAIALDSQCEQTQLPTRGVSLMQKKKMSWTTNSFRAKQRMCIDAYADGLDQVRPNLGHSIRGHPLTTVATSQRDLILGAGSGSTATHSLQGALRMFGLTVSHYTDNPRHRKWTRRILSILGGAYAPKVPMNETSASRCRQELRLLNYSSLPSSIDAVMDTPVAEMFIDMFLSFPRARVILTTRPPHDWVATRLLHDKDDGFVPIQEPCGLYLGYGRTIFSHAEIAGLFDLNNRFVRCFVPKTQLFELNVWLDPKERMKTMMTDLAQFLGISNFSGEGIPFPHL